MDHQMNNYYRQLKKHMPAGMRSSSPPKTVVLLAGLLFILSCIDVQGQLDCKRFHNGTFKIVSEQGTSIVKRKGRKQTETAEGAKDIYTLIVNWIDDCTYTLRPTRKTRKKDPGLPKNAMLTVHIIEVRENSYIQTTTANFADFKLTNEMVKID
jgi:hypothetical protein